MTYGSTRAEATHGDTRGPERSYFHRRTVGGGLDGRSGLWTRSSFGEERGGEEKIVRGQGLPSGALP